MVTVAILGGGSSLAPADVRRLAYAKFAGRCKVIATNDAVYLAWWADQLHAADSKWWHAHIDRVQHFQGLKTSPASLPARWGVEYLQLTGNEGFDPDPQSCRGDNSGYQALHGAVHAGALRVVLLGFDMRGGHWHEGHANEPQADYESMMLPRFATLLPALEARKVDVINCSPGSALTCFRSTRLQDVL